MKSVNELALELAALKAFGDHIATATAKVKTAINEQLRRGTLSAYVENGDEPADVGTVVVVPPRFSWAVVDEAAFLDWVRENVPTAIVEAVRSSDQKAILDSIETMAREGKDIPDGVGRVRSTGYVQVKQTADQRDALLEAAGDGRLPSIRLPELEGS